MLLVVKNLSSNAGNTRDTGLIPGSGRPPRGSMSTHFSILSWRIPWTKGPGGVQSIKSQRVRHNRRDLALSQLTFYIKEKPSCYALQILNYALRKLDEFLEEDILNSCDVSLLKFIL